MFRTAMKLLGPILLRIGVAGTVLKVGPGALVATVGFVPTVAICAAVYIGVLDVIFYVM